MLTAPRLGISGETRSAMAFLDNFLYEHGIDIDTLIQIHRDDNIRVYEDIAPYLHRARYELFISSISWSVTEQGVDFWDRISRDWENSLNENIGNLPFFDNPSPNSGMQTIFKDNSDMTTEEKNVLRKKT